MKIDIPDFSNFELQYQELLVDLINNSDGFERVGEKINVFSRGKWHTEKISELVPKIKAIPVKKELSHIAFKISEELKNIPVVFEEIIAVKEFEKNNTLVRLYGAVLISSDQKNLLLHLVNEKSPYSNLEVIGECFSRIFILKNDNQYSAESNLCQELENIDWKKELGSPLEELALELHK